MQDFVHQQYFIVLRSVDNLKYWIHNYPIINPVTVVPGCFIVHPFYRRSCGQLMCVENLCLVLVELWSRLVCIVCLIILSLLFLLLFWCSCCYMFLLLSSIVIVFLLLLHFLSLLMLRSRTWALCWPSSRHLPGNESVWSWEDSHRSDCVGMSLR